MLVQDLFENVTTTESALEQLLNNCGKMTVLYSDTLMYMIKNLYAEGNHEDMKRTSKTMVGRYKGKWFAENYLSTSSRRESPISGIKNTLTTLSRDPRFKSAKSLLDHLGGLPVYMSSAQRMEQEASFGKLTGELESLPDLLKQLIPGAPSVFKQRLESISVGLKNAIQKFYSIWDRLHNEWEAEWGDETPKKAPKPPKDNTVGAQNSQVEQVIGSVLASLDKKVAHDIRTTLNRSDNKLAVLQQELTKRGIKF